MRAVGVRDVLGLDSGLTEDVVVWREFLQGLVARGVRGVKLVISDAHPGLKQAVKEVFPGGRVAALSRPCPAQPARPGAQERLG
jgi:transposase-like protein